MRAKGIEPGTATLRSTRFGTPAGDAFRMFTLNGIGTQLYGKRDQDADGWYTATKFFCIFFFPVLPLSCHRVRRLGLESLGPAPGFSTRYEMYPIEANVAQARNVLLVAYGVPLIAYLLLQWLQG